MTLGAIWAASADSPVAVSVLLYLVIVAILRTVREIHREHLTHVVRLRRRHERPIPYERSGVDAAANGSPGAHRPSLGDPLVTTGGTPEE